MIKTEIFNDLTRRANRNELMAELEKRGMLALDENGKLLETKWISCEKRNVRGVRLLPSKWEGQVSEQDKAEDTRNKWQINATLLDPNEPLPEDCF